MLSSNVLQFIRVIAKHIQHKSQYTYTTQIMLKNEMKSNEKA